jgi:hypothetical protein
LAYHWAALGRVFDLYGSIRLAWDDYETASACIFAMWRNVCLTFQGLEKALIGNDQVISLGRQVVETVTAYYAFNY